MKRIQRFLAVLCTAAILAALSACGGGGSSSGVGTRASTAFAGTYNGFANVLLSAPGVQPEAVTGTIVFVINPDGTVIVDPTWHTPGTGLIQGNVITASYPGATFNAPGFTCVGPILLNATVTGNTITGTLGPSTTTCNGVPITIQGNYTAWKVGTVPITSPGPAPAPAPGGNRRISVDDSLVEGVSQAAIQALTTN
ncbi:hypothetical protein N9H39_06640 [Gammaproteobacteria bacterium]|nr:hypothetical protein [Gammaproteobacteria bacterium]